jgi:NAD-dependent SIR2 family protein deacetylase
MTLVARAIRAVMSTSSKSHPWHADQKGPPNIASVAKLLSLDQTKNVVLMVGSGISVSAGLPDFRSPKTGLYANLQKYNLPHPEAIFDIDFFRQTPQPFFAFAKELYPGNYRPTLTHTFFTLLHEEGDGKLLRCFTQNVDCLERMADLPEEKLVEAHGSFASSKCIECKVPVTDDWMRKKVTAGEIAYCEEPRCKKRRGGKGGLVKPDIVFFGEGLPKRFFDCIPDLQKADVLIVMGTSLQVHPFASLIDRVPSSCPRVLINLERVGEIAAYSSFGGMRGSMNETGFDFEGYTLGKGKGKEHIRDVFYEGKCDDGILELARGMGWEDKLLKKHADLLKKLDREMGKADDTQPSAEDSADKTAKAIATEQTQATEETKSDSADAVADDLAQLGLGPEKDGKGAAASKGTSSL